MAWNKKKYTAVGTTSFVVPAGVTEVMLFGFGGGGGGGAGGTTYLNGGAAAARDIGGGGGGGATPGWSRMLVTPGASVSVVIGDGGDGGAQVTAHDATGLPGGLGGATSFGNCVFYGAGSGAGGVKGSIVTVNPGFRVGGKCCDQFPLREAVEDSTSLLILQNQYGQGGSGSTNYGGSISVLRKGMPAQFGETASSSGGTVGADTGGYWGGGAGGGGGGGWEDPGGTGGDGGDAKDDGTKGEDGGTGGSPSANSGAGGGGGGGGGGAGGPSTDVGYGGAGGHGGSGLLVVYWWT